MECDTIFSEKGWEKIVDFIIYPAKNGEEIVGSAVEVLNQWDLVAN